MATRMLASPLPPRHEAPPAMRLPFAFFADFRAYMTEQDAKNDVRLTCPECDGFGNIFAEGATTECDRCEGTGRIVPPTEHAAGLCLKPTCGEIRCVALRADILSRRAS